MKRIAVMLLAVTVLFAAGAIAVLCAQCPNGRCPNARPVSVYQWRDVPGAADQVALYKDGVQVGNFSYTHRVYRAYDVRTGKWGESEDCAPIPFPEQSEKPNELNAVPRIPPPNPPVTPFGQEYNGGIDLEKMPKADKHRYFHNGREVDRARVFEEFGAPQLPDDADALRVTWIGASADGEKIRADVDGAPALAAWRGKVAVQSYPSADEPILKGLGYAPGLAVQTPGGQPLWYTQLYHGPDDLAGGLLLADARRKDPKWDPAKWPALAAPPKPVDPLPNPVDPKPSPDAPPSVPSWLWAVGAAVIAFILGKQRST